VKRLIALLLLLIAAPAYGAVAVDADSVSGCTSCSSLSWSHTVGGSGTRLVCGVHPTQGASISAYSFNTVGLSLKTSVDSGWGVLGLWELGSPPTGAHTVAITLSGAVDALTGGCTSFTGAGTLGTAITSVSPDPNPILDGIAITVPSNGMAYGIGLATNASACVNEAPDTGSTERYELCSDAGGGANASGFAASRTTTGTINWTNHPSGAFEATLAVPINESAAVTAARRKIVGVR